VQTRDWHGARSTTDKGCAVSGSNFGPLLTPVTVQYGPYIVVCRVSDAHATLVCPTAKGTGRNLNVTVTIGNQLSDLVEGIALSYTRELGSV
jgi:hypothetical protein